jgi:hypothetical protein
MPFFFVAWGVRRCVAAREAGLLDIPAIIYEPGKPPLRTRLPLNQLYSPKAAVARDFRYLHNSDYPTRELRTEPPPIEVEHLGLTGQSGSVPLAQVVLH